MRRLAILALVCCFVVVWPGVGASEQLDVDATVTSTALSGTMHALIVLPAGYESSHKRYPVIYFLHGLPAGSKSYLGNTWLAKLAAKAGKSIVVEPQGARSSDTDPEYIDWGSGRNWATYLTKELPAFVDSHFRTIRSRAGRAIVGLSAGGYGATMLGLNHLDEFSVIESWSGYFHATDPSGHDSIPAPVDTDVHKLVPALATSGRPTFLAFYVGKADPIFVPENQEFDHELTSAGVTHVFAVYPGGHDTKLWASHAVAWLRLALKHLATPR